MNKKSKQALKKANEIIEKRKKLIKKSVDLIIEEDKALLIELEDDLPNSGKINKKLNQSFINGKYPTQQF
jgi:hypothetical protein